MDIFLFATTAITFRTWMAFSSSNDNKKSSSKSQKDTSSKVPDPSSSSLYDTLQRQNADSTNAIIELFASTTTTTNINFQELSRYEGDLTMRRDEEDGIKLQRGIDIAKEKGVIDPNYQPEPYITIDVLGKTPNQVADEILEMTNKNKKSSTESTKGSVIVLVGLSGTGKGTTVATLRTKLQEQQQAGPGVVTWSNGNIFRSVTLLASTWCEQNKVTDIQKACTKDNLATFMKMLRFEQLQDGSSFDTHIQGLGLDLYVSQVQNTVLKSPQVSKNIPTVAEYTQGEVILFANEAVKQMGDAGWFVLLEGREQTVNYVRTPHRFNLVLSDPTLIGKRRAAQRIMAAAMLELNKDKTTPPPTDEQVKAALETALTNMVKEIKADK